MPNNRFDDMGTKAIDDFFLAHHGIKGQKWGVRCFQNPNGSLTPAGRERYLKNTKRKKKEQEADSGNQAKIAVKSGVRSGSSGYEISDERLVLDREYTVRDEVIKKMLEYDRDNDLDRKRDYHYEEDDKRSEYKKKVLGVSALYLGANTAFGAAYGTTVLPGLGSAIGTGVGAGVGLLYAAPTAIGGAARLHQGTKANKNLEKTIKRINENTNVDPKTGLKLINGEHSEKDDMAAVNPGYKNFADTTKNNCILCTVTYDLRRKGYDVTAMAANKGWTDGSSLRWYKNAKLKVMESSTSANSKYRELVSQPDGSGGNLMVSWKYGGGHSMWYEVKDGKVIIRDNQTNKVFKGNQAKRILEATNMCSFIRTDNLEPNIKAMKEDGVFYGGENSVDPAKKKEVKHSDPSGITFDDILAAGASIEHYGIPKMRWGERRYQYMDGSLTPAGRERYLKGGRESKKELKALKRREKILSDRKKLYKHRDEFSKEELDEAMKRFASQDALKKQMDDEKQRQQKEKEQNAQAKFKYKQMKLQAKIDKQAAKEKQKQAELQTQQSEIATQQKQDTADLDTKAQLWKKRTEKLKTVVDFARTGKTILDDMGITSKETGESLFGAIAESLGIKDSSGKIQAAKDKAARALESEKIKLDKEKLELEKLRWNVVSAEAGAKKAMQGVTSGNQNGSDKQPDNKKPDNKQPAQTNYSFLSGVTENLWQQHKTKKGKLDKRYTSTNYAESIFSPSGGMSEMFKDIHMDDVWKILNAKGVL